MRQTLAGYIREHLPEIEDAIWKGMSHAEILKSIHKAGFTNVSVLAFRNYLSRARAQAKNRGQQSPATFSPGNTSTAVDQPGVPTVEPAPAAHKSGNPLRKAPSFEWTGTMNPDDIL